MNEKQLNFAYKIRHALNENLDNIPTSTTDRLASARKTALSRKKKEFLLRLTLRQDIFAGKAGYFVNERPSWLARLSLILPLIVLAAGLVAMYQHEQQRHINNMAEIDAEMLADELPLSAYLDYGFNAYLAERED